MDKKTGIRCIVLQIIILALSGLAYKIYGVIWAIIFFAVSECTSIIIISVALYRNYRYSSRFITKKALQQADSNLSAADLREWVQFSNSLIEEAEVSNAKKSILPKVEPLVQAQKEWLSERRTERGEQQYNGILSNWRVYIAVCALDKRITETKKCQLEIIYYMLTGNASIKSQNSMIEFCNKNDRSRETVLKAIDQLLIQRVIVIALDGCLDYYRINLGWKITWDIQKAKEVLIKQSYETEKKTVKEQTTKALPKTVIEKHKEEDIAKSVAYYRKQIIKLVVHCLQKESDPISIMDLLANHTELGAVNQLTIEEIMNKLVNNGYAVRMGNSHPPLYRWRATKC